MEWTEDMFATEPVLEKIEALEQQLAEEREAVAEGKKYIAEITADNISLENQLIEAEALLFRSQLLLDGQDCSEKLFVEINDYYKQYILPTHKK